MAGFTVEAGLFLKWWSFLAVSLQRLRTLGTAALICVSSVKIAVLGRRRRAWSSWV